MHDEPHRFSAIPSATGGITRLACALLRARGKDDVAVLAKAGLTPAEVEDTRKRIEVRAQISFLNHAAEALGDDLLGFHLAQDFDLRKIGLLYYVMASSQEIVDALRSGERYCRIVNDGVQLDVVLNGTLDVSFRYINVDRNSDRHQIEFWMVTLMRIVRQIAATRLIARELRIGHAAVPRSAELGSFFGASAEFQSTVDRITFPKSVENLPVAGRDSYLNDMLRHYAEEAISARTELTPSLRTRIEEMLPRLLVHGRADLANVARQMNMSPRTLSRRLEREGLTYSTVLGDLRSALARRYLRESELPVSQIAWLLGFEEVSSLTHAFRRWTGMTPRQFRSRAALPDRSPQDQEDDATHPAAPRA